MCRLKLYLLGWIYVQQLVDANPDDSIKPKLKIKQEQGEGSFVKSAVKELTEETLSRVSLELTQLTDQLEKSLENLPELKQSYDKLEAVASNQVSEFIAPEQVYLTPDAPPAPQIANNNVELLESGYIQPRLPHLESPSLSFEESFSAQTPVTPIQTSFYQVNAPPPQFYLTPPPPPKAPDNIEENFHELTDLDGDEGASLPPPPPGYYDYLNTIFINQGYVSPPPPYPDTFFSSQAIIDPTPSEVSTYTVSPTSHVYVPPVHLAFPGGDDLYAKPSEDTGIYTGHTNDSIPVHHVAHVEVTSPYPEIVSHNYHEVTTPRPVIDLLKYLPLFIVTTIATAASVIFSNIIG